MSHYFESGFSYRQALWHGLGAVIDSRPNTIIEAQRISGLDWRVNEVPVFYKSGALYNQASEFKALVRSDNDNCLGVVSQKYTPIQNSDMFGFTFSLLDEAGCKLETAGSLKGGKIVWALANLEDYKVDIGGYEDELTETYLLITTSHDGTHSCRVMVTKVRVCCFNTLSLALSGASNIYNIRHIGNINDRLDEARNALGLCLRWNKEATECLEYLGEINCDDDTFYDLMTALWDYDEDDSARKKSSVENNWGTLSDLYENINSSSSLAGTRYAALQAVSEFSDYYSRVSGRSERQKRQRRFARFADGKGSALTSTAMSVLMS